MRQISAVHKGSWDPQVYVIFQGKDWVDREFCIKLAEDVASPWVKHHQEAGTVMFMDNLDDKVNPPLQDILKQANCSRFLLPPKTTAHTQPVDWGTGLGNNVKGENSHELELWLGSKDNLNKWENGKLSDMEKEF